MGFKLNKNRERQFYDAQKIHITIIYRFTLV